jgi:hypothetical protein
MKNTKPNILESLILSLFKFNLLILFMIIGSEAALSDSVQPRLEEDSKRFNWMAFGDLRSYIEPCGCDPATDLGGVLRLSRFVLNERTNFENVLLFNLGNNADLLSAELKDHYINKFLSNLHPTASLINEMEFSSLVNSKQIKTTKNSVLSNVKDQMIKARINPYLHSKSLIVFGYLSPAKKHQKRLVAMSQSLIKEWKEILSKNNTLNKVLLFSGNDDELKLINSAHIFELIISSNYSKMDVIVDGVEKENPRRLLRLANNQDPSIYQTPLGGQGVLLGGELRGEAKISLDKLLKVDEKRTKFTPAPGISLEQNMMANKSSHKIVEWLTTDYQFNSPAQKMMDQYNTQVRKRFEQKSKVKKKSLLTTPFVG